MSKNIIINFPTNFGDTVMALPVLDRLRASYPKGRITAIASYRTKDFLIRNTFIDEIVLFNKLWPARQKLKFSLSLRGKYDIIADLKNSLLPLILNVPSRTPFCRRGLDALHIKDSYLKVCQKLFTETEKSPKSDFQLTTKEKAFWDKFNLKSSLFVACSSLSVPKRYSKAHLKQVLESLLKKHIPIVVLGEKSDKDFYQDILKLKNVTDLVGETTLGEVFYLLKNYARLVLSVETGILHLGSYLNIPIVALFGSGDTRKAHPWSSKSISLRNTNLSCWPCDDGKCKIAYECMKIEPQKVIETIEKLWPMTLKKF